MEVEDSLRREVEAARADYEHARVKFRRTLDVADHCVPEHRLFLIELAVDGRNEAWDAYRVALERYNDHLFGRSTTTGA